MTSENLPFDVERGREAEGEMWGYENKAKQLVRELWLRNMARSWMTKVNAETVNPTFPPSTSLLHVTPQ